MTKLWYSVGQHFGRDRSPIIRHISHCPMMGDGSLPKRSPNDSPEGIHNCINSTCLLFSGCRVFMVCRTLKWNSIFQKDNLLTILLLAIEVLRKFEENLTASFSRADLALCIRYLSLVEQVLNWNFLSGNHILFRNFCGSWTFEK